MARFLTCHTCALPAATCGTRAALQSILAGTGVTTVRHRCRSYTPAFEPGDAVKVETYAWFHKDEGEPPPKLLFPGYFIRLVGPRALVHVAAGVLDLSGEGVEFEPQGRGYLKVPLGRVSHRDAEPVDVTECRWCASILSVGDTCGRDPNYTPAGSCQALVQAQASGLAAATAYGAEAGRAPGTTQSPIQQTEPS